LNAQAKNPFPSTQPAWRPIRLWNGDVRAERRADGSIILRAADQLGDYPPFLTDRLEHWASSCPNSVFITQRNAEGARRQLTYGEALHSVRAIGQYLAVRNLGASRPVAVLSENTIEFALLKLACLYTGVLLVPVSPAYALLSKDFLRLRQVMEATRPGLVFAANAGFRAGIEAAVPQNTEIVLAEGTLPDRDSVEFSALLDTVPGLEVERARTARQPDDIAKLLFTSGSSGTPKGVINTHRMISSNQQMMTQTFAFLQDEKPVLVDWLPWHHTFGGNHNFGIALYNGGTLHIDEGRPTPAGFAHTIANLRELAPTIYFNVPRGFDMLLNEMNRDAALAETFFSRVRLLYYAAAALSAPVWQGLAEAAIRCRGERIPMLTGLGSTETGPFAVASVREAERPGEIGVPAPGVELKLAPCGHKMEVRLRSPSIMPGYWQLPELSASAFDEEGFYRMGDAAHFKNPDDPAQGLVFDGRIGDDFKLATGVWVNVANVRARVLSAMAPLVQDAIVVGHDRDEVGVLLVPDHAACRAHLSLPGSFWEAPALAAWLLERLHVAGGGGSSERVARIGVLRKPFSLDAGEITDKGSLNARRVSEIRAGLVDEMYRAEKLVWEKG
jgi:feruloyl-CoA synthase